MVADSDFAFRLIEHLHGSLCYFEIYDALRFRLQFAQLSITFSAILTESLQHYFSDVQPTNYLDLLRGIGEYKVVLSFLLRSLKGTQQLS